jgi:RNA polymerase sigma-70 factor (ECF subfamily)
MRPSAIIAMNKAIAVGYAENAQSAIEELLSIKGLEQNHFYHAALGNFYQQNGDKMEALKWYEKALLLVRSCNDITILKMKIDSLDNG